LLKLPGHPTQDAADALACAICHAHAGQGWGGAAARQLAAAGDTAKTGQRIRRGRLV
jgi:crossover junction endodeoxyribonuclease RuvC